MNWRSYFWPCAFFLLLGIMIGLGSGVFAYRYRKALVRRSDRLTSSVIQVAKSTITGSPKSETVRPDGSLVLASFENQDELRLFSDSDARLDRTTEHATDGQYSLKVTIPDGGGALGAWRSLPRDWSSYEKLVLDVYSPEGGPPLSLYVKDSRHTSYSSRYNEENIRLKTGPNVIEIPLKDIARKIDLKDIKQFRVFLWKVPGQHVYYFDNIRLESAKQSKLEAAPSPSVPTGVAQQTRPPSKAEIASKTPPPALRPPRIDDQEGSLALASFESESELRLFSDSDAKIERTREHSTDGQYALKVTIPDGGGALGAWRSLPRDWSRYEKLVFDIYSPEGGPPISLYVKDSKRTSYGARYNEENIRLQTGPNVIEIPLRDIARKINLKDIYQIRVFLWKVPGQHIYYFDNFRLEGGSKALAEPSPPQIDPSVVTTLASFESDVDLSIFKDSDVAIERTLEQSTQGRHSLKAIFPDGGGAIGTWKSMLQDWSGYKRLHFDVYSTEAHVPLSLYIKDSKHKSYRERYNREGINLQAGWNHISISLSDVSQKIDLRDIVQFRVFLWKVPGRHVLYFDNFQLESEKASAAAYEAKPSVAPVETSRDPSRVRIWAVGESYKIRPDKGTPFNLDLKRDLKQRNEVWDGATNTVSLAGARNEYIGFQIILEALDKPLEQVSVVPPDFKGPTHIEKKHIQLFREHYITVKRPSGWPQPSTGPGEYPDPLVPLELPSSGGPFDVPPGHNQAVWVDIYIPERASAGLYTGNFTVNAKELEPASITVKLEVWGFTLPKESHLTFWSNYYDLAKGYKVPDDKLNPTHQAVERDLWRLSSTHRIAALLRHAPTRPHYTGSGRDLKLDWSAFDKRAGPLLEGTASGNGAKPDMFLLPITYAHGEHWPPGDDETFLAMCKAFARHFDEKGWDLTKAFIYLGDEPSPKEYPTIKRLARLVRQADSRFKTIVAFIKFPPNVVEEFAGLVDLWMINAGDYSSKLLGPRKARGELTGFYQSSEPYIGNESLDADGLAFRTWPWIAWKHKVDVVYLYSMTEWWRSWKRGVDPWVDPLNWSKSNNQGIIIYPGSYLNTKRVIGSIRMKQIRRGMQDYEYLYLAKLAGADPSSVVNQIIHSALDDTNRGWGSPGRWERDPARWYEARKKLAALILQGQKSQAKTKDVKSSDPSS